MHVTFEVVGRATVVTPHCSELDASTATDFLHAAAGVAGRESRVVLDLSAVDFMDRDGVGAIRACLCQATHHDSVVVLCGVTPPVRIVCELAGLSAMCDVFDDLDEALRYCRVLDQLSVPRTDRDLSVISRTAAGYIFS